MSEGTGSEGIERRVSRVRVLGVKESRGGVLRVKIDGNVAKVFNAVYSIV